jgi:hypothetical protein
MTLLEPLLAFIGRPLHNMLIVILRACLESKTSGARCLRARSSRNKMKLGGKDSRKQQPRLQE